MRKKATKTRPIYEDDNREISFLFKASNSIKQASNWKKMNRGFSSDIQRKLAALLIKSKDLVQFASDVESEMMLQTLVTFARKLLAEKDRRLTLSFGDMALDDLIDSGL